MTAAELQLVIKAKDQSAKTFTAIKGRLNKFKSQVGRVAGGFKQLSKKFGTAMSNIVRKAKWAALATVAAFGAMVTLSIKEFAKLQNGLLNVQKTTGMSNEELEGLRKSLEKLILTTRGMTMEGLLNAATVAGQLGIKGTENIKTFSKTVEMMAIATRYTAEGAALDMAKISNVLGLPIANAERLGDVINELSNETTALAPQIGEIAKRAGGMTQAFGMTTPEILALAATMIDVGKTAQIGASTITRLLTVALLKTKEFAFVSGIEFGKYKKMMIEKPMSAINAFIKGLGKIDKFKRSAALENLGLAGVRVLPTLLALSDKTEILGENVKIANKEWGDGGSLMEEYKNKARGLTSAFKSIWEAIKVISGRVGEVSLIGIQNFTTKFQKQILEVRNYIDKSGIVKAFQSMFDDVMGSMTKHMNILGWVKRVFGETPAEVQANLEKWKIKFIGFRKWLETHSPLEPIKEAFKSILKYAKWVGLAIGLLALATNKWLSTLTLVLIAFEAIQKVKEWGKILAMNEKQAIADRYGEEAKGFKKSLDMLKGKPFEKYYRERYEFALKKQKEYLVESAKLAENIYTGKARTPISDFSRKTWFGVEEGDKKDTGGIKGWFEKFNKEIDALGKGELAKTKIADAAKTAKQAAETQTKAEEAINKSLKERIDIYAKLKKAKTPIVTAEMTLESGKREIWTKERHGESGLSGTEFDKILSDVKAKNAALQETAAFVEEKFKDQKVSDEELNAAFNKHFKALMESQNEALNTNNKIVTALIGVDNNTKQNSSAYKQLGTKVSALIKKINAVELQNKQVKAQLAGA